MALFDASRNVLHNTTAKLFGEMASWTPSTGGVAQLVQVNFNHPEKDDALGSMNAPEWEFTALDTWIEYQAGQFTGLKEAVDHGRKETVILSNQNGDVIGSYRVTKIRMVATDGNTFRAKVQLMP